MTTPTALAELEAHVTALDARRRAIAEEIFRGNRAAGSSGMQQNPALSERLRQLSLEASAVDAERQAADRQLREVHEREVRDRAWLAAMPVMGAHRQLLAEIATLADQLAGALADELAMHITLRQQAGHSALPGLHSYSGTPMIERLQRLSEIARITSGTGASPAREQEPAAMEGQA